VDQPGREELQKELERLRGQVARLKAERARYALAFEASPMWLVLSSRDDGRYLEVNEAFLNGTGYTREEVIGRSSLELGTWDDAEQRGEMLAVLERQGQVSNLEVVRRGKDGRRLTMLFSCLPVELEGQACLLSISLDITHRKKSEARRLAAERRFRDFFDHAPIGIFRSVEDGRFLDANQALAELMGYGAPQELISQTSDIPHQLYAEPEERAQLMAALRDAPGWIEAEPTYRRLDGSTYLAHLVVRRVAGDGQAPYVEGFLRDITESRRAEESLKRSERMWRDLIENVHTGIMVHGAQGEAEMLNAMASRVLGMERDAATGLPSDSQAWRFLREDLTEMPVEEYPVNQVLASGEAVRDLVMGVRRPDRGEPVWVLVNAVPLLDEDGALARVVVSSTDISERVQMESQLREVQKLESLGVLAGGIAHDFNNMLMGVLGHAGLALMDLAPDHSARASVEHIQTAAKRLADLTHQLLAYSGKGRFVVQPLDITALVEELGQLLGTVVSKKAALHYKLDQELPAVEADATQVRQVVMNLITNASDALGDEGGIIRVNTGMVTADRQYLASTYLDEDLVPGDYVFIEVSDTGCGMDTATRARLFDPFFTTKFAGRGLGLAAVLGIVRGHRGAVKVYSEVNQGTTIKVLLPASSLPVKEREAASPEGRLPDDCLILVVDDEELVREVARASLERHGCRVLEAGDGGQAVDVYREQEDAVSLVLLDMTMPRLGGVETFRQLRNLDPGVKVILSSGYNEQEATSRFAGKGLAGFLQKPYTPSQLMAKVREVLGE